MREKTSKKMWAFGHICPAWPKAYARKNQSKNVGLRPHLSSVAEGRREKKPVKKCGPSATSVRRGRRPAREKTSQKMWAFGHICTAWPKACARKKQSKNVGLRPHLYGVAEGLREKICGINVGLRPHLYGVTEVRREKTCLK
jgi:hypothetical protein